MRTSLVEILLCQDFSVVSCSSKSININSTLLKRISYNNLPILFACSPHWYLLFIYSLIGPLMVWIAYGRIAYGWIAYGRIAYSCITGESESLTVESLTVESLTGMSQSLTVNRLRLNRLRSNRLGSNHLRSNRLRCYADRLCDRVLLGHRNCHLQMNPTLRAACRNLYIDFGMLS